MLRGRKDRAVQVGGINVQPERIAARLRDLPFVADCSVRLESALPEPRLKAFVVPGRGQDPAVVAEAVAEWCRAHCTAAERPARIDIGERLPVSELGKPADWTSAG